MSDSKAQTLEELLAAGEERDKAVRDFLWGLWPDDKDGCKARSMCDEELDEKEKLRAALRLAMNYVTWHAPRQDVREAVLAALKGDK
jgi:hypothetical protein